LAIGPPDDDAVACRLKGHVRARPEAGLIAQVFGDNDLPFCSHLLSHTVKV
jgi:hypothetical protein